MIRRRVCGSLKGAGRGGVQIHGKSNIQINFRANLTYLFRAGLKVIDHYEHPDDADEDDQFDVATHDVSAFFSLSLFLSLFGYWTAIVTDVSLVVFVVVQLFDLAILFDDVVFHCVKQKAFIHSLIAHTTNTHTHTYSHNKHTHTHTVHNYS